MELSGTRSGQTVKTGRPMAASIGTRAANDTTVPGYYIFNTTNRFRYYQELAVSSPHVSTSLVKLGLSLTKGMAFTGTKALVDDFEEWSVRTNLIEQIQSLARILCRDGVYIAQLVGDSDNLRLVPLLMPAVTLVPDGVEIGGKKSSSKEIMTPPVTRAIVNEQDEAKRVILDINELVYGTINAYDYVQKDVMGRETFGIYGTSLLSPIELSIRNLLNINHGYVSFVHKYGNGRYVINFDLLEQLVEKELISIEDAQAAIDNWMEKHKYLKQNEDIVGAGMSVVPVDAHGSLDVMAFKKSLETDIQIGLFQSALSMGDSKGSTYAAGYVSEADRMVVMEGLQRVVRNIAQRAIDKRLTLMNRNAGAVSITFTELSLPKIDSRDILEWYNSGVLSQEQLLQWSGFDSIQK